jgi:predicted phage-related endonuclease
MLTSQQIADRAGKLTASRVACLMTGDKVKVDQLYREMIGEGEPDDLSHVWPVRLGEATEKINLEWYQRKHNPASVSIRHGWVMVHPKHQHFAATLDGWDDTLHCPIECKHCGGREPLEVIIDRYQPQLQWQMYVTGAKQCALSVIMGANEPIVEYIDRDEDYIKEMVTRASSFMLCVQTKTPPVALDPVPAPTLGAKVYDMTGNNYWAHRAACWLEVHGKAAEEREYEKSLKVMVPDDAKKCHGHGVQITRDRAGRLSLRESASE